MKNTFYLLLLILMVLNTPVLADDNEVSDETETYTLSEVHVTAPADRFSRLPERDLIERPFTESPGLDTATSVIGRPEIEEMHPFSLVDAMNYVPGSWTETRGRKVKKFFSVRGQRYPYPGYLVDGAWFREFHEINYYMSAANFDRIEVLRSSSALLLGPGGLTGMINLVPRVYDSKETQFEGLYGTNDMYRGNISHGSKGEKYNYALSLGQYHTDGPSNRNAEENMTNLYGRVQYLINSKFTFSWSNFYLEGDRQLKTALPPASNALQTRLDSFDPMKTYVTVARLRHQANKNQTTELAVNYGSRRLEGHRVGSADWLEHDYEYGATIVYSRELNRKNILRLSGLYNRWITPTGKRFYVGNRADILTYSAAAVDDHDFGKLDVSFGYRFTREYIKEFGGFNVEGSAGPLLSVKVNDEWSDPLHAINLGASYAITNIKSLFGNFAWGQLASQPGLLDINLQQPGAEDRFKFDLGFRQDIGSFGDISLSGFYVRRNNAALTSKAKVVLDSIDYALYASEDQKNYGVELDMHSRRFKTGIQFFLNGTLMETERTQNGAWLDDEEVPNFILSGGVTYTYKKLELGLYTKHLSAYENERFLPGGSAPAPLGDFTNYTGQVTYYHDKGTKIYMRIENLADDEYSTVAGYPHDGTLYSIGLAKTFK
ncbi:TonB-dependent receptor plug domain-containing protein [Thermodesulfobacteriota bacterium]